MTDSYEEATLTPLVVLTGAGVSAESGVPTFRGAGGLWRRYRAQDLATPAAFQRDPRLVWEFYAWRREVVAGCRPNAAHRLLAEMERALGDLTLITQNVDGLHQEAGSRKVLELHGSLWRLRCTRCPHRWEDRQVPLPELPPRCSRCGALARPDVVWFGEPLDPEVVEEAIAACQRARTMLVIGTSAQVSPAADLPLIAAGRGARVVEINLEDTPLTPMVDEALRGPATEALRTWWERVRPPNVQRM